MKPDDQPQKNLANELLKQAVGKGPAAKQSDDKQDFLRLLYPAGGPGADAARWEYKVVPVSDLSKGPTRIFKGDSDDAAAFREHAAGLERALNELGEQGWELCIVTEIQYVFKRRPSAPGTSFGFPSRK